MPGETSLDTLLRTLKATLHPSTYVFVTIPYSELKSPFPIPFTDVRMMFHESEGVTMIIELSLAVEHHLTYSFPSRMITLEVHSSLEAVGFMAVISTQLSERGLSSNPVSGFYHDHLFVPEDQAAEAMKVLEDIAKSANEGNV